MLAKSSQVTGAFLLDRHLQSHVTFVTEAPQGCEVMNECVMMTSLHRMAVQEVGGG